MNKKTKSRRRINKKRRISKKKGGNLLLDTNAVVGTPWGPLPSQWPQQHNGNWYTLNKYTANMPNYNTTNSNMKGGKKTRRRKKGGGIIPADLTNLYQGLGYNFSSMWNSFTTGAQPTNPAPYVQNLK